ncbi:hypothetical protein I6A84_31155 [Frankia sp. CNm7]|uniref:Uncharacterized protein n=1 Tax=Frankia nepalensis TaxID=1836974 RepID=A0A937UPE2_9ACTN|nr:hypothetical protein [Frankia nepalensis]MBL7500243.1 hypothetical protein [Frankia nepalensis]MBL7513519.1 hypothetical protein [Frankia nepalensis]MBL7522423.1 hypothetical protein [Frankia nepalensis]MBL7628982.1 hypothetical protein [Frankia nepalensis]
MSHQKSSRWITFRNGITGVDRSQPRPGLILAARVLAESGDNPHHHAAPKARKN